MTALPQALAAAAGQTLPNGDDVRSESAATSVTSGTKRKRETGPKFYAVRVGKKPDIYHSWPDCLEQVKGFKGATYKSFTSLTEAEAFMDAAPTSKPAKSTSQKFYAVQNGRVPGVYMDWPSAQAQITGWTKPKHKSFTTRAEAEAFVKAGGGKVTGEAVKNVTITGDGESAVGASADESTSAPASKKQKKSPVNDFSQSVQDYEPGEGPLPPDAEDGFDRRIFLDPITGQVKNKTDEQLNVTKLHPAGEMKGGALRIYTDGSALGNGAAGAIAGVGVFFGLGDPRNASEALAGQRQTNQRAELTAVQRALELAPLTHNVEIYSDSNYAINCVTVWYKKWRENGWMTASRKPVDNKDLVEVIVNRIEERERCGVTTGFTWLKGHANDPGNVAADALAVAGARNARINGVAKAA